MGSHSVYIKGNTEIGLLNIKDENSDAHIVVENSGKIENTVLFTGAKLETSKNNLDNSNLNPFSNIIIRPSKNNEEIVLDGIFQCIQIEEGAQVKIAPSAKIRGQVSIQSGAKLEVCEKAEVNKVCIAPVDSKKNSPVILKGNLKDVEIEKESNIEIESGNIELVSSVKNNIKISQDAKVVVRGEFGNINPTGNGAKNIEKSLNKLSDKCDIERCSFDGVKVNSNFIQNFPSAKKVKEVLNSLITPSYSKTIIIDENNKEVPREHYITSIMKIKVIAENKTNSKIYKLGLAHGRIGQQIDGLRLFGDGESGSIKDINNEKGKLTCSMNFIKAINEDDIDGYYIGINGVNLEEKEDGGYKKIYEKFVPACTSSKGLYKVNISDLDISKFDYVTSFLTPVYKGKLLGNWGGANIIDNIGKDIVINTKGLTIKDFKDKNLEQGRIGGTIEFTRPNDETNIGSYQIWIEKELYSSEGEMPRISRIPFKTIRANGSETYSINLNEGFDVNLAKRVNISIIPIGVDGSQDLKNQIVKEIKDLPQGEENIKLPTPSLTLGKESYSVEVGNLKVDTVITLYIYDESKKDYVKALNESGKPIIDTFVNSNIKTFFNLQPGKYKVIQSCGEIESEMSKEVIVRPIKVNAIVTGEGINVVNALDGANIKLYDKNKKPIKQIEKNKDTHFNELQKGTYFVTQEVNNIESEEFKVEVI